MIIEYDYGSVYGFEHGENGMKIGVACGGTGGHIFPGLAVADVLKKRGHEVVLWLTGRDVEAVSTSRWSGSVVSAGGRGLPTGLSLRSVKGLASLAAAFMRCWLTMRKNRPDVLIAMGGYGSVGPALAAKVLGVPVVLHEANVIPGRAVDFLSRYAAVVAISFDSAAQHIRHARTVLTGFPVRQDVAQSGSERLLRTNLFTVLVMGGSQGAHRLNEVVTDALCRLHRRGIPVQVIHLSGTRDEASVRKAYTEAGLPNAVCGFLKDMVLAYNQADLVIARAGAATCAEMVLRAVPGLLIPLPSAMRDHQTANALALQAGGGVDVMAECEVTAEKLADYIKECYHNPGKLDKMRESLKAIPMSRAADRIADLLEAVASPATL